MKKCYLDIMVAGRFYCQLPFLYAPIFSVTEDEIREYVVEKRPSLKNKEFNVIPTNNRL